MKVLQKSGYGFSIDKTLLPLLTFIGFIMMDPGGGGGL